jgi:replicative DNA helicase
MDASFARLFRGTNVVIIPDRDKAGIEGAKETAARLFGVAASVGIAELPADYVETGGPDVRDVLRQRDGEQKICDTVRNARQWSPDGLARALVLLSLPDAIRKYIDEIGTVDQFVKTGLPRVDFAISGGLLPGEVMIVAGRPSHGKTMVGLQALDYIALTTPVLMISEEMSISALAQRTICGVTALQFDEWHRHKEILKDDLDSHLEKRQPCLVAESCGSVERAVEAIAKAKADYDIGAVVLDYLQLLKGAGSGRYEQITNVSMQIKQAAVRYNVVMIALCQLNRAVEGRQTSTPRMSDLRDSGSLEQDADVIMFVEWLYQTKPDAHDKEEYRLSIAKNRNRAIRQAAINCVFKPERQRIYLTASEKEAEESPNYEPGFAQHNQQEAF